ncbi:MAG: hypothetical protein H0V92_00670 [Pseudonocardiales bacterium]|nr:hypothetical protein [Pseudonocardiales bacterium]
MAQAWLRAERARELVVLRAHHLAGTAWSWLVDLPVQEGLRVWLISPRPLPLVAELEGVVVTYASPTGRSPGVGPDHPVGCGCDDLNLLAPARARATARRRG